MLFTSLTIYFFKSFLILFPPMYSFRNKHLIQALNKQRRILKFRCRESSLQDPGDITSWIEGDCEGKPKKTSQEITGGQDVHYSIVSRHLEQLGKVIKLDKWVPQEGCNSLAWQRSTWRLV